MGPVRDCPDLRNATKDADEDSEEQTDKKKKEGAKKGDFRKFL